jgi:hypothetical protein
MKKPPIRTPLAARRKTVLRVDTVDADRRGIERVFGLPRDSVRLQLPSGRRARGDNGSAHC